MKIYFPKMGPVSSEQVLVNKTVCATVLLELTPLAYHCDDLKLCILMNYMSNPLHLSTHDLPPFQRLRHYHVGDVIR